MFLLSVFCLHTCFRTTFFTGRQMEKGYGTRHAYFAQPSSSSTLLWIDFRYHHCSALFIVIVIMYRYHSASQFWRGMISITHLQSPDGGHNCSLSWWGSNHCSFALHFHFVPHFSPPFFDDNHFRSRTYTPIVEVMILVGVTTAHFPSGDHIGSR